jgi:hypothetical protein
MVPSVVFLFLLTTGWMRVGIAKVPRCSQVSAGMTESRITVKQAVKSLDLPWLMGCAGVSK